MSSLMRRLEIRIMQRAGYSREKWIIDKHGKPQPVRRDGEITGPDDSPIGRDWPEVIPLRAKPKHSAHPANHYRVKPRALRRSKRSQAWLVRRAEERAAKARGETA